MPTIQNIAFEELGLRPFAETLEYQKKTRRRRQAGEIGDRVLFVEHPRVITQGRRPADEDYRVTKPELRAQGYDLEDADRGGKLTYHGPGQMVAYFILSLKDRGLGIPEFVHRVETAVIATLANFEIAAQRRDEYPGVWVKDRKIASVGFNIDREVSMNGIALNVDPDLEDFKVIVPCGIPDCEMTSMRLERGRAFSISEVLPVFKEKVLEVL
ncbi:MAG: lipoyl(octanoyl) transferase LipB [Deltaproteobacteria bacterium]|nr:lipoyl(octanoyl) transferase LipB [Deltaproteobacteria bacterium]